VFVCGVVELKIIYGVRPSHIEGKFWNGKAENWWVTSRLGGGLSYIQTLIVDSKLHPNYYSRNNVSQQLSIESYRMHPALSHLSFLCNLTDCSSV
jgi:hypothetical protein